MNSNIDVIIPWVDGSDPKWLEEKSKYQPQKENDDRVNRYRDWGILKYWFRGIEKFAPWVRRVHFITWGHLPEWLDTTNPKLHIVNHKDYIPQEYLPVFSSHPIELNMHRIEGLADQFVYFNDDMFLIDHVKPEHFFRDGLPVDTVAEVPLRFMPGGIDHIIANNLTVINKHFSKRETVMKNKKLWFSLKAPSAALKNLYMLAFNGFSSFDNPHIPIPYLKSTLGDVWEKEPEILESTSSHKFRSNEDVNQWLFRYWQFAKGTFVQGKNAEGKFFSIGRDNEEIASAIRDQRFKMICLSDDNVELDFEKEQAYLTNLFETLFPEKSSFEK